MNNSSQILPSYFSFASLVIALVAMPFSTEVCHIGLLVYVCCWAVEGNWNEKFSILKRDIILQLLIAFFVVQVAGIFYSHDRANALFALEKKAFLFLIPVTLGTSKLRLKIEFVRVLLFTFVSACLLACLYCLANAVTQLFLYNSGDTIIPAGVTYLNSSDLINAQSEVDVSWLLFSYVGLSGAINIHPAYLSLYVAFSILILVHTLLSDHHLLRTKIGIGTLILFFCFVEVFLSTRIVIYSLIAALFSIAVYQITQKKSVTTAISFIVVVILMAGCLWINPVSFYRNVREIHQSNFAIREKSHYRTSAEIRASLWWLSWKAHLNSNRIIGNGTGDVKESVKKVSDQYQVTNILDSYDPHNQYLTILIANGIVGLAIFLAWMIIPTIMAIQCKDFLFVGAIFLFGALCLTESALELQKGIVFIAVMQPLMLLHHRKYQSAVPLIKVFNARN